MATDKLQTSEITDYEHIIPKVFKDESPGYYSFRSGSNLNSRNQGIPAQKSGNS